MKIYHYAAAIIWALAMFGSGFVLGHYTKDTGLTRGDIIEQLYPPIDEWEEPFDRSWNWQDPWPAGDRQNI